MDFERAKFEIIQKSTKKFQRITNETRDAILKDIQTFNFSKMIDEVVKNIIEGKFEPKDITSMMIVISELHQIYSAFTPKYLEELKKALNDSCIETSKGFKNDEEEEKKMNRRKVLTSLAIETYLYGIDSSFNQIKTILSSIVSPKNTKEQFFTEFPMLVFIMKTYGFLLFKIKSKKFNDYLVKNNLVEEFNFETPQSDKINKAFCEKLKEFYTKKILLYLEQEHTKLNELEEKNFENAGLNNNSSSNLIQKLNTNNTNDTNNNTNNTSNNNQINENSNNDNSNKENTTVDIAQYTKMRNNYIKYIDLINKFANTMNFDVPELASEKTLRYENQKKAETKLEKINKYDPFSDEKEYKFYTVPISTKLYEPISTKPDDGFEPSKKLDNLIEETIKCDTKETIDFLCDQYLYNSKLINQTSKRLYLFEKIIKDERCTLENIKYFARLYKNISPIYQDLLNELTNFLIDNFNEWKPKKIYESKDKDKDVNINTGALFALCLKDARFISEMVKFGAFPIKNVFSIIEDLLDDFKFKSIETLCQILDNCGRYIYLNQERFGSLLDKIKKMAHNNLTHDDRAFRLITNSLSICKPQSKTLIKKVKKRSIEEEYLRFLMNNCLNSEENNIRKVACLIRRFDWNKDDNIIFKVIFKYLLSNNEDKISNCCRMLYLLKNYHQKFFFNLINVILEEIRIGLERNDFNDNQHKLILAVIIGNFYLNKIINTDLVFYVLYMIITFNPQWSINKELMIDNPLDSPYDTFRIQMILKILEICGKKLILPKNKENLNKFIEFLQMYILSKQYLSIEIENKIISCFDNLGGYTIFNDFSSALKNSSVYEGLGKEIDEELRQFEEKEEEKNKTTEKKEEEKKEDKKLSEDTNEFKRDEDNEDIKIMNFDEELQKIISESLTKVQGASMSNAVINPLMDVKKKELNKNPPPVGKMRLFTKHGNKIVITEVKKEVKEKQNEEEEDEDDYGDDENDYDEDEDYD